MPELSISPRVQEIVDEFLSGSESAPVARNSCVLLLEYAFQLGRNVELRGLHDAFDAPKPHSGQDQNEAAPASVSS